MRRIDDHGISGDRAARMTCAWPPRSLFGNAEHQLGWFIRGTALANLRRRRFLSKTCMSIIASSTAMQPWVERFRSLQTDHLSLDEAHARCCDAAIGILPSRVSHA